MRIGIFSDQYYPQTGGIVNSINSLKKSLINNGHEVIVVTIKVPGYECDEKDTIRLTSYGDSNTRTPLFVSKTTMEKINALNFDVIHTHTEFFIGRLGQHVAKKLNVPVVHTCHTNYETFFDYTIENKLLKKLATFTSVKVVNAHIERSNLTIVPSQKTKNEMKKYDLDAKINVIPSGIDMNRFHDENIDHACLDILKEKYNIGEDDYVFLSLSRLAKEKRIDVIIHAFAKLDHSNTKLMIVGDGPEKESLMAQCLKLGVSKNVIFTGHIDPKDIPLYYKMSDVFISASKAETQGLTIVEAMASGTFVLTVDDDNIRGVIQHDETGKLFKHDEEIHLMMAEYILYDNEKIRRQAEALVDKFTLESFGENIIYAYEEAMNRGEYISWKSQKALKRKLLLPF